ncbi:MAG: NAD+ synthase [Enterobacteriaceae bacterium]
MKKTLSIALAQLNWLVGDIEGNAQRMLQTMQQQQAQGTDLVMFSELGLCGYPPEDLLYRDDFHQRCQHQLTLLQQASTQIAVLVGHPWREGDTLYNSLSLFAEGKLLARYHKQMLPNYSVFDEKRYFSCGEQSCVVSFKGYRLGLLICEDLWYSEPVDRLQAEGADIVLSINASPYNREKLSLRQRRLQAHARRTGLPLVYLNQIGGQDELVFDGSSRVIDGQGQVTHRLATFTEQVSVLTLTDKEIVPMAEPAPELSAHAEIYQALVLAVRDYVNKNGFNGVVLGLSGGIDSALTMAIAVDALGAQRVQAVMMPFRYTAAISVEDASEQAEREGVNYSTLSIEPMFDAFMQQLSPLLPPIAGKDTTEENMQARCRGVILMALSNRQGSLVLTTGNKSEMAVGYATLYGDMAGGFAVLKDVPKTMVYQLSQYRNSLSYTIPQRVIDRPPSAELAPGQVDQDTLPPYDILDAILAGYVEQDKSVQQLVDEGFTETVVRRVIRMVDLSEYKRRQAAVGPRVTVRSFGKDRRYPITSAFGRKNW